MLHLYQICEVCDEGGYELITLLGGEQGIEAYIRKFHEHYDIPAAEDCHSAKARSYRQAQIERAKPLMRANGYEGQSLTRLTVDYLLKKCGYNEFAMPIVTME